ncbi:DUF1905 domain-containing protein [Novosphingobium terrae]|uniref:DUF1905 domain-containing protein n=1 Tax=Novosphingobium terrae TaxID=2726189 RepID=UPI001F1432B2|nr:DUF1905 domain-containing protein [Novosphingobium terrae]
MSPAQTMNATTMHERDTISFSGKVWVWTSAKGGKPVRWFFVTVEDGPAAELKLVSMGLTAGFGSLPVKARIGTTTWRTSVFPHRESGGWLLPLKAAVRKEAGIREGDEIEVTLEI